MDLLTIAGVAAAIGSWRASANLSTIERRREHTALTPQFHSTCYRASTSEQQVNGAHPATLTLILTGPTALRRLTNVTAHIRGHPPRTLPPTFAGGPPPDVVAREIWGPLQFAGPIAARTAHPFTLEPHEPFQLSLDRTAPPTWWSDSPEGWRHRYGRSPLLLRLEGKGGGRHFWRDLALSVPVESQPSK